MKVEIKRDAAPTSDYPHQVWIDGALLWLSPKTADALEASLIPDQSDLPDGFRRWPDGTILARGDAWNRERGTGEWERLTDNGWGGVAVEHHLYVEVRRTQQTELVPAWRAPGRKNADGDVIDFVLSHSVDFWGSDEVIESMHVVAIANSDGMVEVLK